MAEEHSREVRYGRRVDAGQLTPTDGKQPRNWRKRGLLWEGNLCGGDSHEKTVMVTYRNTLSDHGVALSLRFKRYTHFKDSRHSFRLDITGRAKSLADSTI